MKPFMKFTRQTDRWTTIGMVMLFACVLCSCHDDNDVSFSRLSDIDWNDTDGAITINDEYLKDASARFISVAGSDSATIVLSGVHPTEEIEMNVATTPGEYGDIIFRGEQTVEDVRHLKVAGRYHPYGGTSGYSSKVRVVVTYTVPNKISSKEITMPLNGTSGFRYHYDSYWHPSQEEVDSCEFIIGRINSELGRHLKNLSFKFGDDGNLTFSYTNSKSVETQQTFRYWIDEKELSQRTLVNIDNSELFYEFLLNSLTPVENRIVGDLLRFDNNENVRLQIDENDSQGDGVVILGDMHYKIFPYLYTTLPTDNVWTGKEKDCFDAMERVARHSDGSYISKRLYSFAWAFGNGSK